MESCEVEDLPSTVSHLQPMVENGFQEVLGHKCTWQVHQDERTVDAFAWMRICKLPDHLGTLCYSSWVDTVMKRRGWVQSLSMHNIMSTLTVQMTR